jgi:hypothetical protein
MGTAWARHAMCESDLSLTSKRKLIPLLELRCLLLSPALRSNGGMANRQGDVDFALRKTPPPVRTSAWLGLVWLGLAWFGLAWLGLAWLGSARLGSAWPGLPWRGVAWPGLAWPGL